MGDILNSKLLSILPLLLYLGAEKPAFLSIRGYISFIKADQAMWYRACKACNKKVTESTGAGYWCESCQKYDEECNLRYIMVVKVTDASGKAFVSTFNEEAEKIIGCPADELDSLRSQEGEDSPYQLKLKQATWTPHLLRVSVSQNEYNNEKRQRITARAVVPVDVSGSCGPLLFQGDVAASHCNAFSNRLYNFKGKGDKDPLGSTYAAFLKTKCKSLSDTTTTVAMDPGSAGNFDSHYYPNLLQKKGLFQSDATLLTQDQSRSIAEELVDQSKFFTDFAQSMQGMGAIKNLVGSAGEIWIKCSVVNS
ncbi:replication protein A 70 kDa dna-binding subunit-like [Trifolium medium]|uniref:Peroxidase n=1 Tax=Trifolium medium TaxID=97028 RepID=A0A392LY93_9FABA|nr:replication protein A 70 kDa dna-binding subunit-like [Trifolium medium]